MAEIPPRTAPRQGGIPRRRRNGLRIASARLQAGPACGLRRDGRRTLLPFRRRGAEARLGTGLYSPRRTGEAFRRRVGRPARLRQLRGFDRSGEARLPDAPARQLDRRRTGRHAGIFGQKRTRQARPELETAVQTCAGGGSHWGGEVPLPAHLRPLPPDAENHRDRQRRQVPPPLPLRRTARRKAGAGAVRPARL